MLASSAALALRAAPLRLSQRATANMLLTLTLASIAALALTLAPLRLLRLNNQKTLKLPSFFGGRFFCSINELDKNLKNFANKY